MATIPNRKRTALALGALDSKAELQCFEITRPEPGPTDASVDIRYCGMCHSDCHACNGDWGLNSWPIAPGHKITGIVCAVRSQFTKFKVGDKVGVGCMVGSCRNCDLCKENSAHSACSLTDIQSKGLS